MRTIYFIIFSVLFFIGCSVHPARKTLSISKGQKEPFKDEIIPTPDIEEGSTRETIGIVDYDGNTYKIVNIGKQSWMAENLRVTHFNDGTPISGIIGINEWSSTIFPAYTWYGNDSASYALLYGALYNWYAVSSGKLCPEGWHVPRDAEWQILANYLGGNKNAGGKLKDTDTTYWYYPNAGATNETGFTALPGGGRCTDGIFGNLGLNSIFWTSTEFDDSYALFRNISHFYPEVYGYGANKKNGFSVRCVKNK